MGVYAFRVEWVRRLAKGRATQENSGRWRASNHRAIAGQAVAIFSLLTVSMVLYFLVLYALGSTQFTWTVTRWYFAVLPTAWLGIAGLFTVALFVAVYVLAASRFLPRILSGNYRGASRAGALVESWGLAFGSLGLILFALSPTDAAQLADYSFGPEATGLAALTLLAMGAILLPLIVGLLLLRGRPAVFRAVWEQGRGGRGETRTRPRFPDLLYDDVGIFLRTRDGEAVRWNDLESVELRWAPELTSVPTAWKEEVESHTVWESYEEMTDEPTGINWQTGSYVYGRTRMRPVTHSQTHRIPISYADAITSVSAQIQFTTRSGSTSVVEAVNSAPNLLVSQAIDAYPSARAFAEHRFGTFLQALRARSPPTLVSLEYVPQAGLWPSDVP
jgi:hypothetical protein